MKNCFFLIIIFTCLIGCKNNTVDTDLILGDWEFTSPKTVYENDSLFSTTYIRSDYRFRKDSIFHLTDGFFQRIEGNKENKYFGTKSKFYIENDSLYIFIPFAQKYYSQKIVKLTKDTLALHEKKEDLTFYYTKRKAETPSKIKLSQITLSLGPCFGNCPISSISVDLNGNIIYLGESNTQYKGLFKGKIDKEIFKEIVSELNKIKFTDLENEYSVDATDLSDISITFINKNKIIKTIYAYGHTEPRQLRSILNRIVYLYQEANLKKIEYEFPILNTVFSNYRFHNSEAFYLQTLLLNGNKTEFRFEPTYRQKAALILPEDFNYDHYNQIKRNIETDGRYFKLESKNHQYSTFDIGFNFFKTNESFSAN